jgi:transposase-like protein
MAVFRWTPKTRAVASALAEGKTRAQVAAEHGVGLRTIYRWLTDPEFAAEVDRLSLMVDVAGRAERMRIAMRAVRQRVRDDGTLDTEKDVLDWLKFAQSETDGLKLGLSGQLELRGLHVVEVPAKLSPEEWQGEADKLRERRAAGSGKDVSDEQPQ